MFTGIVEELGEVADARASRRLRRAADRARTASSTISTHGDSIAVNGVCLTVVGWHAGRAVHGGRLRRDGRDAQPLGHRRPAARRPVNLERAVRADGRLGGHIVQGHVDGTGVVVSRTPGRRVGGGAVRAAGRPGPLRRREGLDHGRRGLADRDRRRRRLVRGQPDPRDAARDHARRQGRGRPGQPGGRRARQVRRTAARPTRRACSQIDALWTPIERAIADITAGRPSSSSTTRTARTRAT